MSMQSFPHHYHVSASGKNVGSVNVSALGLSSIATDPPPEFGGPEGQWSPETLFVGAIADCYLFTFRALAKVAQLRWSELSCDVEGILDKGGDGLSFTHYIVKPRLVINSELDLEKAHKLLVKSEKSCLVVNSLKGEFSLKPRISYHQPESSV